MDFVIVLLTVEPEPIVPATSGRGARDHPEGVEVGLVEHFSTVGRGLCGQRAVVAELTVGHHGAHVPQVVGQFVSLVVQAAGADRRQQLIHQGLQANGAFGFGIDTRKAAPHQAGRGGVRPRIRNASSV